MRWGLLCAAALFIGCGDPEPQTTPQPPTTGVCTGKCDAGSGLLGELESHQDPIAQWLRGRADVQERGILQAGYGEILSEINAQLGCEEADAHTYVVSDGLVSDDGEALPRSVSVACVSSTQQRFKLFMSMPDLDESGDWDDQSVEMFAWDEEALRYRFYRTSPGEDGQSVEVEPAECAECHLAPDALMAIDGTGVEMMPVMNELVEPWAHWNAEPQFRSQQFSLPEGMQEKPVYKELTSNGRLGSASVLEQIIREAQKRVVSKRYKSRREEASVAAGMGFLRPLFCAEQVNWVAERGDSGLMPMGALVDDGIRNLYTKINATDWPYPWFYNQTHAVRFGVAETEAERFGLVPVRGAIDQELELKLTRVLSPEQLLQVRYIDWKNPAISEFRCGLWTQARERMRTAPPELAGESVEDIIPQLYAEVMQLDGVAIKANQPEAFILLADATEDAVAALGQMLAAGEVAAAMCPTDSPQEACECGELGVCEGVILEAGQIIQTYVNRIEAGGRGVVRERLQRSTCLADQRFSNRPFIESVAMGACSELTSQPQE